MGKERQLAIQFSRQLKKDITENGDLPARWDAFIEDHKKYQPKEHCMSHDYCDANQSMIDAFEKVWKKPVTIMRDDQQNLQQVEFEADLMTEAWNIAKENNFFYERIK